MYKILIADDHPLFREAIVHAMEQAFAGVRLVESEDLEHALARARSNMDLDLILLDLDMPGMEGLYGLSMLRNEVPTLPVAIVSAEDNRQVVLEAMALGAVGFISKASPRRKLIAALEQILDGDVYLPPDIIRQAPRTTNTYDDPVSGADIPSERLLTLTRRQLLVLERLVEGESNKQIANRLNIAETTVKSHVSAILAKLEVNNRLQAVLAVGDVDFTHYLRR